MGLPVAKISIVRVGVSNVKLHFVVRLLTASSSRSCGTELKKPTRSWLVACWLMCGCVVEIVVEVLPKLWDGQLTWSLRKETENHGGDCCRCGSEEGAKCDLEWEMIARPLCQCFLAFK